MLGASARKGSFGNRLATEISRSGAEVALHFVNPRYSEVLGRPCVPSLRDIAGPVDLVLFGVGDFGVETEMRAAASRGDRAAVVFGSLVGADLRDEVAAVARDAGMALCGAGCMGFVNVSYGLRAIGYLEPEDLGPGPVALLTHSGSAFSALLRTRRHLGFSVAVSSGQELVTTAGQYLEYALDLEATKVVALVLETLRDPEAFRSALARAADSGVPVVALTVGSSAGGRAMVEAHSGALAGGDATWEALFAAYGVIRVADLDELADTVELFASGRRAAATSHRGGIATVHDSGAERALAVDVAQALAVPYAEIGGATLTRLSLLLDEGLVPANPLDVWGSGRATRELFAGSLLALAADDEVAAVALSVDLVPELDGDEEYQLAVLDAKAGTDKPVVVLSNLQSAIDQAAADRLRISGVPVLEGTRSGLLALRHLLEWRDRPVPPQLPAVDEARRRRWSERLRSGRLSSADGLALLSEYGISSVPTRFVESTHEALAAAGELGYPVALKTDAPGIDHKSDVGGVVLALNDPEELRVAYQSLAFRLGPKAAIAKMAPDAVELALGVVRDPLIGPIVVVGAGGLLVELLSDRSVALAPVDRTSAEAMLRRLKVHSLLEGARGRPPAELSSVLDAIVCIGVLASELGGEIDALDVNPLRCLPAPSGAVALDVLVV